MGWTYRVQKNLKGIPGGGKTVRPMLVLGRTLNTGLCVHCAGKMVLPSLFSLQWVRLCGAGGQVERPSHIFSSVVQSACGCFPRGFSSLRATGRSWQLWSPGLRCLLLFHCHLDCKAGGTNFLLRGHILLGGRGRCPVREVEY